MMTRADRPLSQFHDSSMGMPHQIHLLDVPRYILFDYDAPLIIWPPKFARTNPNAKSFLYTLG